MAIDYGKIPDGMFLPAYMIRDIRKASILPRNKRIAGKPDIVLQSPLGITEVIPRKLLVSNFRYLNGKRIHLGAWRGNKANLVILAASPNIKYYAMKVPETQVIKTDDKVIKNKTVYIVCGENGGAIDRERVYIVSPKMFQKMFKMEGSIGSLRNKKVSARVVDRTNSNKHLNNIVNANTADNNLKDSYYKVRAKAKVPENTNKVDNVVPEIKYTPVAKIMYMGKVVGFMLLGPDNCSYRFDMATMTELVRNGKVNNVAIRRVENGEHLYGVGIRLSELPEVQ